MTTTPSPPSPSNLRPAIAPPPPAVGPSVRDAPPKPRPGSLQPILPLPTPASQPPAPSNLPSGCPGHPSQPSQPAPGCPPASQSCPQPTRPTRSTRTSCQARLTPPRPRATCPPANQSCPYQPPPASHRPRVTCPPAAPASQSCPSQVTVQPALPGHPHACSQILTFRPLPIKPHVIFIGKGRFCLYLCHACICAMPVFMALPVFALPVNTNIPGTHWGAPGISVKDQSVHLMILVTRPEPTVRPPSRIAKPRPSSMAMGWIS